MKTLLLMMLAVSLAMQDSAFAAGRGGVFTKFKQLPVVQRLGEVVQGTSSRLAYKALAVGMLAAAACGMTGCGGDDVDNRMGREEPPCAETVLSEPVLSEREEMLQGTKLAFYTYRHVYFFWGDKGEVERGYVIANSNESFSHDDNEWYAAKYLVQLADGSEQIIRSKQIGGFMFRHSISVGEAVELLGDTTNEL